MEQDLKKAIIETLVFFDLFDFPLTKEEIWRFLYRPLTGAEEGFFGGLGGLERLEQEEIIRKRDGYYFLAGHEQIVEERKKRFNYSLKKKKRAERLVRFWLRFVPNIEGVFLIGPVVYNNARTESDIDFFIIARPGRIWFVRFFTILPLKILNLRPTERSKRDKFCLSYFVTADNLNLETTKINENDILLVYWLAFFLQPILKRNNIWQKFLQANKWLRTYVPNWQVGEQNFQEEKNNREQKNSRLGDWLEKVLKKIQLWYLPQELSLTMNKDKNVIINDQMLKLHSNDKRAEELLRWQERIKSYE